MNSFIYSNISLSKRGEKHVSHHQKEVYFNVEGAIYGPFFTSYSIPEDPCNVIIVLLVSEAKGSFYSIYLDWIVDKTLWDLLKVCSKVNKNYRQGWQSICLAAHVAAV